MTRPINAISLEAQQDPAVQEAMRQIADGAQALYAALGALATTTPRLGPLLVKLCGPTLCEQAAQQGRDRDAALATGAPRWPDRACGCSARFERHADGCPAPAAASVEG